MLPQCLLLPCFVYPHYCPGNIFYHLFQQHVTCFLLWNRVKIRWTILADVKSSRNISFASIWRLYRMFSQWNTWRQVLKETRMRTVVSIRWLGASLKSNISIPKHSKWKFFERRSDMVYSALASGVNDMIDRRDCKTLALPQVTLVSQQLIHTHPSSSAVGYVSVPATAPPAPF